MEKIKTTTDLSIKLDIYSGGIMAILFISGAKYAVDAANSETAQGIFERYLAGTATAEEQALVSQVEATAFEIAGEQGGSVGSDTI